jgi:hypothetical protein
MAFNCGMCKYSQFGVTISGDEGEVGLCKELGMLVHKYSATCERYSPKRRTWTVENFHQAISNVVEYRNRRTKLPRYCILEEIGKKKEAQE